MNWLDGLKLQNPLCIYVLGRRVLDTVLVNFGQTFSFGDSNGIISCSYDVLVNITCWYCWCCEWALFWLFSRVTRGEPL